MKMNNRRKTKLRFTRDEKTQTHYRISDDNKLQKMSPVAGGRTSSGIRTNEAYEYLDVDPAEVRRMAFENLSQSLFRMINDNAEILGVEEIKDVDLTEIARLRAREIAAARLAEWEEKFQAEKNAEKKTQYI